jgi:acetyl esterase
MLIVGVDDGVKGTRSSGTGGVFMTVPARRPRYPRRLRLLGSLVVLTVVLAVSAPVPAGASTPTDVSVQYNLHYGAASIEVADVYRSTTATGSQPAVLIVHGGGWHSGSKGGWSGQAEELAEAGFVVVVANYQLATATVGGFPHQLHELKAAIVWMRAQATQLHIDPRRIGAMGSSAGGNLVAMLATDADGPLDSGDRLRAAVTWSAILDLATQPGLTNAIGEYVGCQVDCAAVLDDASPLHHVSTGDTPIELFNSSKELAPLKTVQAMAARLTAHHVDNQVVIYPGSGHGVDYGTQAMPATIAFLQQQLS